MTEPTKPMRVVSEPAPPLDDRGELVLDDDLAELAQTLMADARHLSEMADVSGIGAQLQREAALLADIAAVNDGGDGAATLTSEQRVDRAPRREITWRQVWRVVPLAAAVMLVCFLAAPPAPPQHSTTIQLRSDAPTATPVNSAANSASPSLPWQELTSPELEGALDLVDETVSISI